MTVLELSQLIKDMEEKFGVSAAAAVAVAGPAAAGGAAAPAEEQTEFTVMLTAVGDNKVNVIKAVREVTEPRPEGGQGPGRRRAQAGEGRRLQGRRRRGAEEADRRRREGRDQVSRNFGIRAGVSMTLPADSGLAKGLALCARVFSLSRSVLGAFMTYSLTERKRIRKSFAKRATVQNGAVPDRDAARVLHRRSCRRTSRRRAAGTRACRRRSPRSSRSPATPATRGWSSSASRWASRRSTSRNASSAA